VSTLGTSGSVFLQHNGTTRLNTTTAGLEINGSAWLQNDGINLQAAGLGINYSVFHNGDTDTAMDFVNSGDQINFRTGNGVRASVNNTGLIVNNDLDVDGHTNLDNVSIAGVTTMSGALIAEGNFIEIKGTMPYLALTDTNSNPDYSVFNSNGVFSIYDGTNSANRLTISSSGNVSILKDLDVDGHTNLDNTSIVGIVTISAGTNNE
ncbi:MAG: hypothetical protein VXY93_18475, partial [Pseudomonadota bacterium]|nr:hypothetical protein [Pseudomonadota bacterium]